MTRIESIPINLPNDSSSWFTTSPTALIWRLIRLVPFKLWFTVITAAWIWYQFRYAKPRTIRRGGHGTRTQRRLNANESTTSITKGATPRRPIVRRVPSQSSLTGSPQSSRRGSGTWGPRLGQGSVDGRQGSPVVRATAGNSGLRQSETWDSQPEMRQANRIPYSPSLSSISRQRSPYQSAVGGEYSTSQLSRSESSPGLSSRRGPQYQPTARTSMKRSASASGSAFGDDRDELSRHNGVGKRSRLHLREDADMSEEDDDEQHELDLQGLEDQDEDEDEDDRPMELDEVAEHAQAQARGQKRSRGNANGRSKRVKRAFDDEDDEADEPEGVSQQPRKHRRHEDSPESDNEEERRASEKRRRAGRRERSGSKRTIEDIDETLSSGFEEDDEEQAYESRSKSRNADSDVDENDGQTAEEDQESDLEARDRNRRHDTKRARSTSVRSGSENDSIMGDDGVDAVGPSSAATPRSAAATHRRRTLKSAVASGKKVMGSAAARASPYKRSGAATLKDKAARNRSESVQRKPGDQWTNIEGDQCRMDEDGQVRKLTEVREMRRKYKMPKDSVHPDAKIMHEVVVERWLTTREYDELAKQGKLAWQSTNEDENAAGEADGDASMRTVASDNEGDVRLAARIEKPRGAYYTMGSGTPLRAHSGLGSSSRHVSSATSRPGSRSGSPSTPNLLLGASGRSSGSNSPVLTTLLNGRMRLTSASAGARGASPVAAARSWSQTRSARLAEDEQKARTERERRRKASIMLGGEEDLPTEEQKSAAPSVGQKDKVIEAPPAKIKIGEWAAPPVKTADEGGDLEKSSNATPSAASPAAPSAVPNLFSGLGGSSALKTEAPAKAESKAPAAKPASSTGFSFGAPAKASEVSTEVKKVEPAAAPTTSLFSFGAAPASSAPSDKPAAMPSSSSTFTAAPSLFSFGAVKKPEEPQTKPTTTPASADVKPPALLFGTGTDPASSKSSTPAPFSFGTPSATPSGASGPTADTTAAKPTAPSLFGSSSMSSAPAPPATASFSFGSTPAAASVSTPPAADSAKPTFSFGSFSSAPQATPATSTAATTPAPSFGGSSGFGTFARPTAASAVTGDGSKSTAPATSSLFSFGAAPASTTTTSTTPAPAAPSPFSFGTGPGTPSTSAAPTTTSTVPGGGFSFGAPAATATSSASTPTTNSGFSFGAAPSTGLVTTPGTAPTTFSFGATLGTGTVTPGGGTRPASPNLFSAGSFGPTDGTAGAAGGRRPVRRLPGRR